MVYKNSHLYILVLFEICHALNQTTEIGTRVFFCSYKICFIFCSTLEKNLFSAPQQQYNFNVTTIKSRKNTHTWNIFILGICAADTHENRLFENDVEVEWIEKVRTQRVCYAARSQ